MGSVLVMIDTEVVISGVHQQTRPNAGAPFPPETAANQLIFRCTTNLKDVSAPFAVQVWKPHHYNGRSNSLHYVAAA
jgi:hypothetical protein